MNCQQLEVMKLRISPSSKLAMIAMIEKPSANREQLSSFMNIDKTQLTATAKRLEGAGLITQGRDDNGHRVYLVNVK